MGSSYSSNEKEVEVITDYEDKKIVKWTRGKEIDNYPSHHNMQSLVFFRSNYHLYSPNQWRYATTEHQTATDFKNWWDDRHSLNNSNQVAVMRFLYSTRMNASLKYRVLKYLDNHFHGRSVKAGEREFFTSNIDDIIDMVENFIDDNLSSSEDYSSDEEEFESGQYYGDCFVEMVSEDDDEYIMSNDEDDEYIMSNDEDDEDDGRLSIWMKNPFGISSHHRKYT